MRLIPRIRTRFLAVEDGFSMIIVMGVMAASALFVAAAFAAANGDLPLTRDSQDRKQAYAAAEAGINYYQYHLNQDPDYWTRCTNVPAPNATENQPVNQKWITGTDRPAPLAQGGRHADQYTLELMPAHRVHELRREQPEHDDRPGDRHVQDPLDGPPARGQQAQAQPRRVVPPPLVPRLPLLHGLRDDGPDQLRRRRPGVGAGELRRPLPRQRNDSCSEIQFADRRTRSTGPLHTNDDILTCGTPVFGRNSADSIEFSGPAPGWDEGRRQRLRRHPVFNGPRRAGVKSLTMPPTNTTLQTVAATGGLVYQGTTRIRFNGSTSNMTVTNALVNSGNPQTRALPANGVIYVANRSGGCGTLIPPNDATYSEPSTCGNLYVSGTYTSSMTLAAANDIIIAPPTHGPTAAPATAT